MDKQEAKDRFQTEMDSMVREALGLPEETEHEIEYRERAAENLRKSQEAQADADDKEEE